MMYPTLNVVDESVELVNDKMRFFEDKTNSLLSDISDSLSSISNIEVEPVSPPTDLPKPSPDTPADGQNLAS